MLFHVPVVTSEPVLSILGITAQDHVPNVCELGLI